MKRLTLFTTACLLAVLAVMAVQIRAQNIDTNDRTFLTFSSAVELPGVTLEAGEYEFRLADTPSRNVVQVFRRSDSKPMGQWTYVQAERERSSDETVVMFKEAREGSTPAVQYWYFPNEKIGKEFIYPKDQAERIAARTGQNVRSESGVVAAQASTAPATEPVNPAPAAAAATTTPSVDATAPAASADATLRNAPVPAQPTAPAGSTAGNRGVTQQAPAAASTSPAETTNADATLRTAPAPAQPTAAAGSTAGNRGVIAQQPETTRAQAEPQPAPAVEPAPRPVGTSGAAEQAPAATPQPERQVARASELPQTASPLPLSGLIGLLSLAGAFGLRVFRS